MRISHKSLNEQMKRICESAGLNPAHWYVDGLSDGWEVNYVVRENGHARFRGKAKEVWAYLEGLSMGIAVQKRQEEKE